MDHLSLEEQMDVLEHQTPGSPAKLLLNNMSTSLELMIMNHQMLLPHQHPISPKSAKQPILGQMGS